MVDLILECLCSLDVILFFFFNLASRNGLGDPSAEVVSLISHATQERLKTILEKLAVIAEHRMEVVKTDARYEVQQDVKGQLKFLEELDKLERRRHSEIQREMLLKAAKSRSKAEDPEQAKLKAKAKEVRLKFSRSLGMHQTLIVNWLLDATGGNGGT